MRTGTTHHFPARLERLCRRFVQWRHVAGQAKPAKSKRVKTGHLEELVMRGKAIFDP